MTTDTICAVATPPGLGGVGIVRVSGPLSRAIARQIVDVPLRPRQARFARFVDDNGATIDSGIALLFAGPASFTGEDVLELQGHGGPQVLQMILSRAVALGARPARPGEFTERAFLNDKIDLVQAEAIADLIEAGSAAAARAAQRSLEGVFSDQVNHLQQELVDLRVFVEAALDFPEEEIDFIGDSDVLQKLTAISERTGDLLDEAQQGQLLRDGVEIAIAGQPNAGKSSLLNALAGRESAIVTEVPGTTRDVLREYISLDGLPAHIADTAGIRESSDRVEVEGIRRARATLMQADLALLVVDVTEPLEPQLGLKAEVPDAIPCIEVFNKTDLVKAASEGDNPVDRVYLSAKTGQGLDRLVALIRQTVGAGAAREGAFSARARHIEALASTREHVQQGRRRLELENAPETLAEELRLAQRALGEITGEYLPDDLLGAIFSSFCIGK
ncbi:MAG: tRNA uridine-5-carboxymethylaminomethyl(34) synthesis GTPase MnmE [Lysobacterales bacterium]|jgi:tRNA modification GTPase